MLEDQKGIAFRVMTEGDMAISTMLLAKEFANNDPLAVALNLSVCEMEEMIQPLLRAALAEQLSVVAYDPTDPDKILGCILSKKLGASVETVWSDDITHRFGAVFGLIDELHHRYFIDDASLGGQKLVHEAMVATDAATAGRGVAQGLLRASAANGKLRGYSGAVAELTGPISQHVFINKHGYLPVAKVNYRSFKFRGVEPFASIGSVDSCVLAIKSYCDS